MNHSKTLNGSAIAVTLIAIAAMTTITLGVAQLVPRDYRQAQALENSLSAEQAAWAGVERALLSLKEDPYYEISQELVAGLGRPFGGDIGAQCLGTPRECPAGIDRLLGIPTRQTPVEFSSVNKQSDLGLTTESGYAYTVWHMAKKVGNPLLPDLNDGNSADRSRGAQNINPILERDQSKVLDVSESNTKDKGVSSVTVNWQPIFHTSGPGFNGQCTQGSGTFVLSYTWMTVDGEGISAPENRGLLTLPANGQVVTKVLNNPMPDIAVRLELRFLATSNSGDDATIQDCFVRYSLEPAGQNGVADLGVSVVESTGYYSNVRRKVRVLVDRQNGQIVDIFDFGIACQVCEVGN